jgi:hypothetical protein
VGIPLPSHSLERNPLPLTLGFASTHHHFILNFYLHHH